MKIWMWLAVAVGGSVGAMLRYGISGWVQKHSTTTFPWGTVAVNVLGCLLMGVLAKLLMESSLVRPEYRVAILVGVLGALTTFSTFSYEALSLAGAGQLGQAAGYVLLTNLGCLSAVWVGYRLAIRLSS